MTDEPTLDGVNSDETNPDTFGLRFHFQGDYANNGDNEVRCRKKELTPGITVHPEKDWAYPGSQTAHKYGP